MMIRGLGISWRAHCPQDQVNKILGHLLGRQAYALESYFLTGCFFNLMVGLYIIYISFIYHLYIIYISFIYHLYTIYISIIYHLYHLSMIFK